MPHTLKILLFSTLVTLTSITVPASAATHIDEKFDYPEEALGVPWKFNNLSERTLIAVAEAQYHKGFAPEGKQVDFIRPYGDNAAFALLESGRNPGTDMWMISERGQATLSFVFSYRDMASEQGFAIRLLSADNTMAAIQVRGNPSGGTARLQYQTTNTASSFTDLPDSPTLLLNTWYRLTLTVTVMSPANVSYDVKLEQLGNGGGEIYSHTGLELASSAAFPPSRPVQLAVGFSSGYPIFSLAEILLVSESLPGAQLPVEGLGFVGLIGAGVAGNRRRRRLRFKGWPLTVCCLLASIVLLPALSVHPGASDWSALRKAKAAELPPLIYNSDGNDDYINEHERLQFTSKEEFYKPRTDGLERLPVAIFYCTGVTHLFSHRTKIGEMFGRNQGEGWRAWITDAHQAGWDPLSAIVEWGRAHGKPVFYTHRMNDLHEAARAKPTYAIQLGSKWTKENRSLLIRPERTREATGPINDPSWYWLAMNYTHQEVRDYVYSLIEEIVTGYDVDGVELDFMRFPVFFRTPADGKPATAEEQAAMNGLVRSLRGMLDREGKKREKPLLLAVHVPDSLDYSKDAGLDVRQWLKEDLVDVVVGGGDFQLRPWRELVAECAPFGVPVYACFNRTLVRSPDAWYGHAFDAWQQGVHGIATFNFFEPKSPILDNIHSREKLADLPKAESYELDRNGVMQLRGLGSFVRNGQKYFADEVGKRWINLPSFEWSDSKWENP